MTNEEKIARMSRLIADKIVEREKAILQANRLKDVVSGMLKEFNKLLQERKENE